VLFAFDEHIGREIAIKELLPQKKDKNLAHISTKEQIARVRFLKEARITGQLEHPGIVPVYEIGAICSGSLYYSMRFVRGKTFSEAIKDAGDLKARLRLLPHFRDLCNAVAFAHSRGVVHRDIKPANIMLGEFGETVVLDWGLAKVHGEKDEKAGEIKEGLNLLKNIDVRTTVTGFPLGTPAYMSPEQASGNIDSIDELSDIYSLGCVLYEILTGRPPFLGENAYEIINLVINSEASPVKLVEPGAPVELAAVVEKTLTSAKENRYSSALDVAKEVENFMSGDRVEAYEYSSWELLKKFVAQNRGVSAAAAALIFVLLAGSAIIFSAYKQSVENEREAHLNLALGYQENADRLIGKLEYSKAKIFSAASLFHNPYNPYSPYSFPDKQKLESRTAANYLLPAKSALYTAEVHKNNAFVKTLKTYKNVIKDIAISPDGKLFAFANSDGTIRIWDFALDKEVAILKGHNDVILSTSFSPDGMSLASASWDKSIRVWDIKSGRETAILKGHLSELYVVAFSPDGKYLASGGKDRVVKVWNIEESREQISFKGHKSWIWSLAFSNDNRFLVSTGFDGEIKSWNLETKKEAASVQGHTEAVVSIDFSPDGKTFATAGWDKKLKIWNTSNLANVSVFPFRTAFYMIKYSPAGDKIALASNDATIKLWDIGKKRTTARLIGHDGAVYSAYFSPDGKHIISSSSDKTVKLWRTDFNQKIKVLKGHKKYIPYDYFSSD